VHWSFGHAWKGGQRPGLRHWDWSPSGGRRPQVDGIPPDDSDGDSSDDDRRDRNRRGRNDNRRYRPRRRQDPSSDDDPDDGDGGDEPSNDSASDENELDPAVRSRKRLCIKLQKFDGTGSWESWWAHFQNCASYNRWMERDKLAFLQGALTGNVAQVLWDTDRSTTNSLKKLVAVLKSRYSGERHAEKYRAELQIRRRKNQESLSELHQDIRRLTVLAYPKLTVEAREQIGCDHFTNALGDPDFALKVKERAPKSLDEALFIALRLEACAKSVKQDKKEDERPDRYRQKARSTAKTDAAKSTQQMQSNDRLSKIEADMTKLHEEMKKLLEASKTPSIPTVNPAITPASVAVQRPATHATASAGERERPQIQNLRNNGPVRPLMTSNFFSAATAATNMLEL